MVDHQLHHQKVHNLALIRIIAGENLLKPKILFQPTLLLVTISEIHVKTTSFTGPPFDLLPI